MCISNAFSSHSLLCLSKHCKQQLLALPTRIHDEFQCLGDLQVQPIKTDKYANLHQQPFQKVKKNIYCLPLILHAKWSFVPLIIAWGKQPQKLCNFHIKSSSASYSEFPTQLKILLHLTPFFLVHFTLKWQDTQLHPFKKIHPYSCLSQKIQVNKKAREFFALYKYEIK